ncbi:MAG: YetF domain-containing protein [Pseudomonadota bacterium]
MTWLTPDHWEKIFALETPFLEIVVRGSVMYLGILLLLRSFLKREIGTVSLPDLLMIVFLADAAQNGMAGEYHSVTDGVLLVTVIIFWNFLLDKLAFHYPLIARLVHSPPVPLIRNGQLLRRNLRRESVSHEELWTHLRGHGVEHLSEVKDAYMEGNGEISVITQKKKEGEEH